MNWELAAFLVVLGVTFVVTPLAARVMGRLAVMDVPNERSSHTVSTPRGGGIACASGVLVGAVFWTAGGGSVPAATLLGAGALAVVGLLDDRWSLPALPRLAAQLAIGAISGWIFGGPLWAMIGLLLVPLMVNVVNFVDGINGITGSVMVVWGVTTAVVSVGEGASPLVFIGLATAAAALGFLPWNIVRTKIFLGDVGSYLFGGLVGLTATYGGASGVAPAVLLAPLSLPLADVMFTLYRRWRRGKSLTQAHREHVYQRLVSDAGLSHVTVSLGVGLLSAVNGAMALVFPGPLAVSAALLLVIGYLSSPVLLAGLKSARTPDEWRGVADSDAEAGLQTASPSPTGRAS